MQRGRGWSVGGLLFCPFGTANNDTNNTQSLLQSMVLSTPTVLYSFLSLHPLYLVFTFFFRLFFTWTHYFSSFPLFPFLLVTPLAIDLPEPPVLWVTEVTETSIKLKWDQRRNPSDLTRKSISHPTFSSRSLSFPLFFLLSLLPFLFPFFRH